jgi:hypothetical protein
MSSNAEILARIIMEVNDALTAYVEPSDQPRDANATINHIMLIIDRHDGLGAAQRILDGYTGPTLVK